MIETFEICLYVFFPGKGPQTAIDLISSDASLCKQGEPINLAKLFQGQGLGIMATADREGKVNAAVYARPHVVNPITLVWGMTDRRTFHNIGQNWSASYLFKQAGPGFQGVRLGLDLLKTEVGGEMLAQIQQDTDEVVSKGTGRTVTHAVWFRLWKFDLWSFKADGTMRVSIINS